MLIHWRLAQAGQSCRSGLVVCCRQVLQQVWAHVWIGQVYWIGEVVIGHGGWTALKVTEGKVSCNSNVQETDMRMIFQLNIIFETGIVKNHDSLF